MNENETYIERSVHTIIHGRKIPYVQNGECTFSNFSIHFFVCGQQHRRRCLMSIVHCNSYPNTLYQNSSHFQSNTTNKD